MKKSMTLQRLFCVVLCCTVYASLVIAVEEDGAVEGEIIEVYDVVMDEEGNVVYEGSGDGDIGVITHEGPGVPGGEIPEEVKKSIRAQMKKMFEREMERIKKKLGATDDEWAIIQPRLKKVMEMARSVSGAGGMMPMMFGAVDPGSQDGETPKDPAQLAAEELQKTLDKDAPTTAEIKAKLTALRGAREKNKQKLAAAQEELRDVLTLKQEAILVMMGLLE